MLILSIVLSFRLSNFVRFVFHLLIFIVVGISWVLAFVLRCFIYLCFSRDLSPDAFVAFECFLVFTRFFGKLPMLSLIAISFKYFVGHMCRFSRPFRIVADVLADSGSFLPCFSRIWFVSVSWRVYRMPKLQRTLGFSVRWRFKLLFVENVCEQYSHFHLVLFIDLLFVRCRSCIALLNFTMCLYRFFLWKYFNWQYAHSYVWTGGNTAASSGDGKPGKSSSLWIKI